MSAKSAFGAIRALHAAGLTRTWLGFFRTASSGESVPVLDTDWEGDPFGALGVFPMRDGRQRPLADALRRRGVPRSDARYFERTAPSAGTVMVVVDANGRVAEARAILAERGARLAKSNQRNKRRG